MLFLNQHSAIDCLRTFLPTQIHDSSERDSFIEYVINQQHYPILYGVCGAHAPLHITAYRSSSVACHVDVVQLKGEWESRNKLSSGDQAPNHNDQNEWVRFTQSRSNRMRHAVQSLLDLI
jgi:nucleosome binding factor SPN SPT16 subunit